MRETGKEKLRPRNIGIITILFLHPQKILFTRIDKKNVPVIKAICQNMQKTSAMVIALSGM